MNIHSARLLLTVCNLLFVGSNYILHLLVARGVSVDAYGNYSLLILIITCLTVLLSSGVPTLLAPLAQQEGFQSKISSLLILHTVLAVVVAFGIGLIFLLLPVGFVSVDGMSIFAISMIAIPFALYSFFSAWMNLEGRLVISSCAVLLFLVGRLVGTYLLLPSYGATAIIYGYSVGAVVATVPLAVVVAPKLKELFEQPSYALQFLHMRQVAGFILFGVAVNLSIGWDLVILRLGNIDPTMFGEYATFATLAKVPLYVATASIAFVWPELNKAGMKQRTKMLAYLITFTSLLTLCWSAVMRYFYNPIAESLLSRRVNFDLAISNEYFIFVWLLSSMYFVWHYMNTFMSRLYSAGSVFFMIVLAITVGGSTISSTLNILTISLGVSGFLCMLAIWRFRNNA